MLSSLTILIILSLCLAVGAWLFFIWAVRSGEFDDSEGPKHRMLEDDPQSTPQQKEKAP